MATYNQERIIKEYWEKVKHLYPDVSFEKFSEACKYPAIFIKNIIKSGSYKTIMVKWVGKFIVYPARVKRHLVKQKIFLDKGIITEEEYQDFNEKYETLVENFKAESPGFILVNDLPAPIIVGTAGEFNNEGLNEISYTATDEKGSWDTPIE